MASKDLSHEVPGLSLPSEGAGNTVSDPRGHQLAMTAPGSESVNPIPTALDRSPLPQIPDRRDRTVLLGTRGEPVSEITQSACRDAGGYEDISHAGFTRAGG